MIQPWLFAAWSTTAISNLDQAGNFFFLQKKMSGKDMVTTEDGEREREREREEKILGAHLSVTRTWLVGR